jgi:hypothetical protein
MRLVNPQLQTRAGGETLPARVPSSFWYPGYLMGK